MGADAGSGALAVTGIVNEQDTVQFHVRDAATAQEDLELLLTPQAFEPEAAGALLFTCNGRGARACTAGPMAISRWCARRSAATCRSAASSAAGSWGPIGGSNFVHGFTASLAIFRPKAG